MNETSGVSAPSRGLYPRGFSPSMELLVKQLAPTCSSLSSFASHSERFAATALSLIPKQSINLEEFTNDMVRVHREATTPPRPKWKNNRGNSAEEGKLELIMTWGEWVRGKIYRRDCTLWERSRHTAEAASSAPAHTGLCGLWVLHSTSTSQVSSSCSSDVSLSWPMLSYQMLFSDSVAVSESHLTFVRNLAIIFALYPIDIFGFNLFCFEVLVLCLCVCGVFYSK